MPTDQADGNIRGFEKDFRISNVHVAKLSFSAWWPTRGRRMTGSAAKRSGRCVMLELKERGVPGGEGTAMIPDGRPADRLKNGSKNGSSFT